MDMSQDLPSLSVARRSVEAGASGEVMSLGLLTSEDISVLKEQLKAAQDSIKFLQCEHASMLKGLHEEIERLQNLCRDLQFRCEAGGCLLPDTEFFQCSRECLDTKVRALLQENADLKRRLSESHQAIDILDQKEKLALWQHHQELEQRDSALLRLERELETALAHRRSKRPGHFWRRLGFGSPGPQRVEHLSREDLPSDILQSIESSSYSSLSDKSLSEDEGFGPKSVRLPPIASRLVVRQQLRVPEAIDPRQAPEMAVKRLSKA